MKKYKNSNEAFIDLYNKINNDGIIYKNTKSLFNIGFYIENPMDNEINEPIRKWKKSYADYEWQWYLSKNRSVKKIKKIAKIWDNMHNGNNLVMSNYGWQWNRKNQIEYIVEELKRDKFSRRACITIYDGKEHNKYKFDTPCTLNINFYILNNKLNMNVLMRSNDLWYGFCNDQYCFSKLLEMIANKLEIEIGDYFHFSNNLHLYKDFLNKKINF